MLPNDQDRESRPRPHPHPHSISYSVLIAGEEDLSSTPPLTREGMYREDLLAG
jgi:hypothetical protein